MTIDTSASKTGEDLLKAVALFGIFSFIVDRANLHYECSEVLDWFAYVAAFVVASACLLLGIRIITDRIRDLYPWIFFGRNWLGITIYVTLMVLVITLSGPVGNIIMNHPSALRDSAPVCN